MDTELDKPTNIVFIGGTGRCGTNLMKDILSEHQQVASLPFEYRFTIDPHGIVDCYNTLRYNWSPYVAHKKIQELEELLLGMASKKMGEVFFAKIIQWVDSHGSLLTPPRYAEWELEKWFPNYQAHVKKLMRDLKALNFRGNWPGEKFLQYKNRMHFTTNDVDTAEIFRSFLRSLINDLLSKTKKKTFVEDNTWNMLYAKELKNILPEARFIHLVRDPRDVIASLKYQRWAPDELSTLIKFYQSLIEKIITAAEAIPQNDILEIKLERLVAEPDKTLADVCNFCKIKIFSHLIKKDLSQANSGRWVSDFDEKEKEVLLQETQKYCLHYSY